MRNRVFRLSDPSVTKLKCPLVLEINGPPTHRRHPRMLVRLAAFPKRYSEIRKVAGLVCVDNSVKDFYVPDIVNTPTLVLGNGIDLRSAQTLPPATGKPSVAMIVSSPAPQHGWKLLYKLASCLDNYNFHVIGVTRNDLLNSIKINIPSNITCHGRMQREQFTPVLQKCSVGIGSLGWENIGRTENSSLKIREYLANGLAVAAADSDVDIDSNSIFWHQINSSENTDTEADKLRTFIDFWHGRRVKKKHISNLDTLKKESIRIRFLKSFTN